jgi:SAM-dependent methyltransferase
MNTASALCRSPISDAPPEFIKDLPKEKLSQSYAEYFGTQPPSGAFNTDYTLWRCSDTAMEFCWPPQGGSKSFYEWISSHPFYYPAARWEYNVVNRLIKTRLNCVDNVNVLDVGCGDGHFLSLLDFLPLKNRCGLDFNEPAINLCRQKGFSVFQGSLEEARAGNFFGGRLFQVITSFHCLEHVEDPYLFVKQLSQACADDGSIFISTPASPMSFEMNWFDSLNHPPHHMTRWNLAAYEALAKSLGLQLSYYYPPTSSLKQAVTALSLEVAGPQHARSKLQSVSCCLSHAPQFFKLWLQMRERARSHPLRGADVILVELKKT